MSVENRKLAQRYAAKARKAALEGDESKAIHYRALAQNCRALARLYA